MGLIHKEVPCVPLEMTASLSICFSQSCVKPSNPKCCFPSSAGRRWWNGLVSALPALPGWLCLKGWDRMQTLSEVMWMFSPLYLWLRKPFQRCYRWCCSLSLGVGLSLGNRRCCAAFTAARTQSPTMGHQSSWRPLQLHQAHSGALATGPELWEMPLSPLTLFRAGWPRLACAEVPIPGQCLWNMAAGMGSGQGHSSSLLCVQWKTGNGQGGASCPCQT